MPLTDFEFIVFVLIDEFLFNVVRLKNKSLRIVSTSLTPHVKEYKYIYNITK